MAMDSRKSRRKSRASISPTFSTVKEDDLTTPTVDEKGDPIVGIRGGTQVGDIGISGGVNTQGQGNIGVGTNVGGVNVGVGVNQDGNINAGISTGVGGGDTSVNAGVTGLRGDGPVGVGVGISDPSIIKSGDVTIGAGAGIGTGGVGVTPTVQIGDSKAESTGAQVGGAAGALVGSYFGPWGTAAGSAIGSALGSGIGGLTSGKNSEETNKRKQIITAYKKAGLFDGDKTITYPDGSVWNFDADNAKEEGQNHDWKDSSKAGKAGGRQLFNYETDYTNDLDYTAGMAGIALSRLFAGDKNKEIDQLGNALGNSFLGKVGYGKEMTQENFNNVTTNAKAAYAKAGIKSKEEMMSIVNKAYADGRIEDSDAAVMKQTADMLFDNNYSAATTLMQGRWAGIQTAGKEAGTRADASQSEESSQPTARQGAQVRVGKIYAPQISPDEAIASVQPLIDLYKKSRKEGYNEGIDKKLRSAASLASGVALATGAYQIGNKLTDGALGQIFQDIIKGAGGYMKDLGGDIGDYLNGTTAAEQDFQATADNISEINDSALGVGGVDVDLSSSADVNNDFEATADNINDINSSGAFF